MIDGEIQPFPPQPNDVTPGLHMLVNEHVDVDDIA